MLDRIPTKPNRYAVYDDAHNFVRYEYHERADEPTQVGDALNKANLLPDTVATALGLTGNPQVKDALERLSTSVNTDMHLWEKCERTENITFGNYINYPLGNGQSGPEYSQLLSIECADSVSVSDNKVITLVNPTTIVIKRLMSGDFEADSDKALNSKFFKLDTAFYKGDASTKITWENDGQGYKFFKKASRISGNVKYAFLGQVASYDSNAYPKDGFIDGYRYTYKGQPKNLSQIETGEYTGTGTFGEGNENSLIFSFRPKVVIIRSQSAGGNNRYFDMILFQDFIEGRNFGAISTSATSWTSSNSVLGVVVFATWDGNSVGWYSGADAGSQGNYNGNRYRYVALG